MKFPRSYSLLASLLVVALCRVGTVSADVTLAVLNPRGEVQPPPVMGIQPRLSSLDGQRVALLENGKMGAHAFFDALDEQLTERYPRATILRIPKPQGSRFAFDATEWYPEVARRGDAFVFGMGD